MTASETIKHWRAGACEAFKWAKKMARDKSYALAVFHFHLAIEKALKAYYMEKLNKPAPYTHSLIHLAALLPVKWTDKELADLQEITPFSAQGRYDDIGWVEEQATKTFTEKWIPKTNYFLSRLDCATDD